MLAAADTGDAKLPVDPVRASAVASSVSLRAENCISAASLAGGLISLALGFDWCSLPRSEVL